MQIDSTIIVAIISAAATILCQFLISHKAKLDNESSMKNELGQLATRIDNINSKLQVVDSMVTDMNLIKTDMAVVKNDIAWIKNTLNQQGRNVNAAIRLQRNVPRVGRER